MYESVTDTPGAQFARGMGMLTDAVNVLTGVDPTELDPAVLGDYVLGLLTESRRVAAVQVGIADRFATSGAWAHEGARSAHTWVASQSNETRGRVLGWARTGAAMRTHPEMAAAFVSGDVTAGHLDALATAVADYPTTRADLDTAATEIVDLAQTMNVAEFREHLAALCHWIDPTAVEKDERKRDSEAYLRLSRIGGGMWRMDGLLPDEVGTAFKAVLVAVRRRLRAEAKKNQPHPADPPDSANETPAGAMDHRFGSRQNIDAFRHLLGLVANTTNPDGTIALPSVNGARPVVHLTVDIESLIAESQNQAAAWLERFGVPAHAISAAKAAFLACDSVIEPMILRDGHLVATLPSIQTVPAHLRKAVLRRDRCCRINSCDAPIDEVHHLVFLSHGGPTTMANLAGLCWYHHHLIHGEGWTLTGDANHELTLTNTTTGQQWTNRPPPHRHGHRQRQRQRE